MNEFKFLATNMIVMLFLTSNNYKKPKYLTIGELLNCGTFYYRIPCNHFKKPHGTIFNDV